MHLLKISLQNKNFGLGVELHSPSLRVCKTIKLKFPSIYTSKMKKKNKIGIETQWRGIVWYW